MLWLYDTFIFLFYCVYCVLFVRGIDDVIHFNKYVAGD